MVRKIKHDGLLCGYDRTSIVPEAGTSNSELPDWGHKFLYDTIFCFIYELLYNRIS